jgi:hypothetical protein
LAQLSNPSCSTRVCSAAKSRHDTESIPSIAHDPERKSDVVTGFFIRLGIQHQATLAGEIVKKFLVLLLFAFGLTAALAQPAPEPEAVAYCSKLTQQPTHLGKMSPPPQALSPSETPATPPETPAICVETVSRYLRHEPQQFPVYKTPDAWVRIFWACEWAEKAGQEPNAAACGVRHLKALKEKPPAS